MARDFMVSVPSEYDFDQREAIGQDIVNRIIQRTSNGIDKNGTPFRGYSKSYKSSIDFRIAGKTSTVNLKLGGDLHRSIRVLSHGKGFIRVGWPESDEADKAKWNSEKGRDMLGLSPSELNKILKNYPVSRPEPGSSFIGSIASEFIKNLTLKNTNE